VSSTSCEKITDYHQCVRAFIPPDIHCTPKFDSFSDDGQFDFTPISDSGLKDNQKYVGCMPMQEPFNRGLGWRDDYEEHCK